MEDENRDPKIDSEAAPTAHADTDRGRRAQRWVTWVLALLTVPGAAIVMIIALGAVMSTAACSDRQCPNLGPRGIGFDVFFYGAPVVSLVTIAITFFAASRRWGIGVPLCGLALLFADLAVLAVVFK